MDISNGVITNIIMVMLTVREVVCLLALALDLEKWQISTFILLCHSRNVGRVRAYMNASRTDEFRVTLRGAALRGRVFRVCLLCNWIARCHRLLFVQSSAFVCYQSQFRPKSQLFQPRLDTLRPQWEGSVYLESQ